MFCNGYIHVSLVFHTYVASVSIDSDVCFSSICCKSRYDFAHVAVRPICSSQLLQLLGSPACEWSGAEGHQGAGAGHETARGIWSGASHGGHDTQCEHETQSGMGPHMKQALTCRRPDARPVRMSGH
jgi:hypothetical protein